MRMNQHCAPKGRPVGRCFGSLIVLFCALSGIGQARTLYVSPSGTHDLTSGNEFPSWAGAATNIQAAVDKAAASGDEIWVTNETYKLRGFINVAKGVRIRSYKAGGLDRVGTIIDGNYPATTSRCFYINHTSAVIEGFTLTNGYASGANAAGGAILYNGTMRDCVIVGCASESSGGGAYMTGGSVMRNCTVERNSCPHAQDDNYGGGGVYMRGNALLENCIVRRNTTTSMGGGVGVFAESPIIRNCLIVGNSGNTGGGITFAQPNYGVVENCTIVSNYCAARGGGIFNSYGTNSVVVNSIVYTNTSVSLPGASDYGVSPLWYGAGLSIVRFTNCCVGRPFVLIGAGNTTVNPLFENVPEGNHRLRRTSPCRNAGVWQGWMTGATDLDGLPRIHEIVDMGAYEYTPTGTIVFVR